jgi:hypothetical protein
MSSIQYARIVFPFRAISFFSLYIVTNTVLYHRDRLAYDYVRSRALYWGRLTPGLSDTVVASLNNPQNFPDYKSFQQGIYDWVVASDVFLAFLFAAMILGLLANQAHICFLIAMLHFIAVILVTHMVIAEAPLAFLISAIVFGTILPLLIELWNLLAIFVFKSDFYFSH